MVVAMAQASPSLTRLVDKFKHSPRDTQKEEHSLYQKLEFQEVMSPALCRITIPSIKVVFRCPSTGYPFDTLRLPVSAVNTAALLARSLARLPSLTRIQEQPWSRRRYPENDLAVSGSDPQEASQNMLSSCGPFVNTSE